MFSRSLSVITVALGAALAGGPAFAQVPQRLGGEFQVDSYTVGFQQLPGVAMDDSGNFVVVWTSEYFDGGGSSSYGIAARRFDSTGNPLGADFQVNVYTLGIQSLPVVDMNASGAFVIAWRSSGQDGAGAGGFARRFNAAGIAQGGEIQVSSSTAFNETVSAIGIDNDGDFVIAWASEQDLSGYGVFCRRFNSAGTPQANPIQVNSYTLGIQADPDLAMKADGDFAITWADSRTGNTDVWAQRYASSGAPLAANFQVNTYATGSQEAPSIAENSSGSLVVIWTSVGQDGSGDGIFGRRLDSLGTPLGVEFQVTQTDTQNQSRPDVTIDSDGDFVAVWESDHQGAADDVFARRIRPDGSTQGADILVNTFNVGVQGRPAVDSNPDGDFVVAWSSFQGDGDVFAQRFHVPALLDVDGNGQFQPLADGVLVLRFGFGFTGATLINGAVGAGCTRCDAPSILAYLQTML